MVLFIALRVFGCGLKDATLRQCQNRCEGPITRDSFPRHDGGEENRL